MGKQKAGGASAATHPKPSHMTTIFNKKNLQKNNTRKNLEKSMLDPWISKNNKGCKKCTTFTTSSMMVFCIVQLAKIPIPTAQDL